MQSEGIMQGAIPGVLPLQLEQGTRFEYKNGEAVVGTFMELYNRRKAELLNIAKAKIMNSTQRRDMMLLVADYNERVEVEYTKTDRLAGATKHKFDTDIASLQSALDRRDRYIKKRRFWIDKHEDVLANLNERWWSRFFNAKRIREIQNKLRKNKEFMGKAVDGRKSPVQKIRDLRYDREEELQNLRHALLVYVRDEKRKLYEQADQIYLKPDTKDGDSSLCEDGLYLVIDYDAWALSEIEEKLDKLEQDYRKQIFDVTKELLAVLKNPNPRPALPAATEE